MTNCSVQKKTTCAPPDCSWFVGKGCRKAGYSSSPKPKKAASKKSTKATKVSKATKVVKKPSLSSLEGHVVVFSGFRSDALKAEVVAAGASVGSAVSGKTTLVVYVKTTKNADKIESLKGTVKTMKLETFMSKYNLTTQIEVEKAAKKASKKTAGPKVPRAPKKASKKSANIFTESKVNNLKKFKELPSSLPMSRSDALEVKYAKYNVAQILRIGQDKIRKTYVESEVRKLYNALFYIPSKDVFMILSRAVSQGYENKKVSQKMYDFVGIEFQIEDSGKLVFNDTHAIIVKEVGIRDLMKKNPNNPRSYTLDLTLVEPMLRSFYDNDIVVLTFWSE